jgi:hypothetical protein
LRFFIPLLDQLGLTNNRKRRQLVHFPMAGTTSIVDPIHTFEWFAPSTSDTSRLLDFAIRRSCFINADRLTG